MSIPVILDCDPGHDDVFAIWLAAAHPNIDLRAVTSVAGNGLLEHTTHNARVALTVAGVDDVPVAVGAAEPIAETLRPADWIHGANALGGPELPEPTVPLHDSPAVELMRTIIDESPEPITIVATGPLTNVGILARDHADMMAKVARVVWMGGSTTRGNVTPYAEFNAWTDPEAIAIVLDSADRNGIDFTMVGLNISHQALITREVRRRIGEIDTRTAQFGVELLEFFCSTYEIAEKMPDGPLHDPITIALLADPTVATTQRVHLDVELKGEFTRGATSVDLVDFQGKPHNATVALDLDVEKFWAMIEDAVRTLA
jgi:purine nucleosidase